MTDEKSILQEAGELVAGDRQQEYGPPAKNFGRIATMWSVYLGVEIGARQVADMMILLKTTRLMQGPHRDSYVDIAGYAHIGSQL